MTSAHDITLEQQEELQEYGRRLEKRADDLLAEGLSLELLTSDQKRDLFDGCITLGDLGATLARKGVA